MSRWSAGLSPINREALAEWSITWTRLTAVEVTLTGGSGTAKFHVPPAEGQWQHCQHVRHGAAGTAQRLWDVYERICLKCNPAVPEETRALWEAAALLANKTAQLSQLTAKAVPGGGTWIGYARLADVVTDIDSQALAGYTGLAARDRRQAKDTTAIKGAWKLLTERLERVLEEYASRCPPVDAYTSAVDAVKAASSSPARRELDQIEAATGNPSLYASFERPFPALWQWVHTAWQHVASRGGSLDEAVEAATAMAGKLLDSATVHDVTLLPLPPFLDGGGFHSPSAWADAELREWWQWAVRNACATLDAAHVRPAGTGTGRRLLLVNDWPLTTSFHARWAWLARYDRHGSLVPRGWRSGEWGGPTAYDTRGSLAYGTVLCVPDDLAKRAVSLAGAYAGLFVTGPAVTGKTVRKPDVEALLRVAFPVLPGDFDGAGPHPSALVTLHRRVRRAAQRQQWRDYDAAEPHLVMDAFGYGRYAWIPGAHQNLQRLKDLTDRLHGWTYRITLECGHPGETPVLANVFAQIASVDPDAHTVTVAPWKGHRPITIPVGRIIEATGAEQRGDERGYPVWTAVNDVEDDGGEQDPDDDYFAGTKPTLRVVRTT